MEEIAGMIEEYEKKKNIGSTGIKLAPQTPSKPSSSSDKILISSKLKAVDTAQSSYSSIIKNNKAPMALPASQISPVYPRKINEFISFGKNSLQKFEKPLFQIASGKISSSEQTILDNIWDAFNHNNGSQLLAAMNSAAHHLQTLQSQKFKYYAIVKGHMPGIYPSWNL
ncbi:Ribonuclease H1, N-terminal, partial [Parasponia andersonii]